VNVAFNEIKKLAVTIGILALILFPIGLICGVDWLKMLVSLLFGGLFTLANFLLLGSICEKACQKSPEKARSYMQLNYAIRMVLIGVVVFASFKVDYLSPLGVLPLLLAPKLTYFILAIHETVCKKKS